MLKQQCRYSYQIFSLALEGGLAWKWSAYSTVVFFSKNSYKHAKGYHDGNNSRATSFSDIARIVAQAKGSLTHPKKKETLPTAVSTRTGVTNYWAAGSRPWRSWGQGQLNTPASRLVLRPLDQTRTTCAHKLRNHAYNKLASFRTLHHFCPKGWLHLVEMLASSTPNIKLSTKNLQSDVTTGGRSFAQYPSSNWLVPKVSNLFQAW